MNMWTASLDARALLGDQIENGQNIAWSQVQYVGTALTDSYIALRLATNDWSEQSLLWISDQFVEWSLGEHSWGSIKNDAHPWLGCNNDRMSHAPKGMFLQILIYLRFLQNLGKC